MTEAVERRRWPRRLLHLETVLACLTGGTIIRTSTANISDGGFHLLLEQRPSLACGDAVTFQFFQTENGSSPTRAVLAGRAHLVHQELLLGTGRWRFGLGFEFDRPQTLSFAAQLPHPFPHHLRLA